MSDMQYSDKSKLTAKPDQVQQGPETASSINPMRVQRLGAMDLQRLVGNQATQRLLRQTDGTPAVLQTKMTVGAADDAYEQEADKVASQVMSASSQGADVQRNQEEQIATLRIQREEDGGSEAEEEEMPGMQAMRIQREEDGGSEAEEEEMPGMQMMRIQREEDGGSEAEEEEMPGMQAMRIQREEEGAPQEEEEGAPPMQMMRVQRKEVDMMGSFDAGAEVEEGINSSRGSGQALPDNIRSNFESSTGYDVSGVTMHNDAQSHQMNRSVGARAFAVGSDIYMGESAPSLDSKEGQEVAYHELTHTIQQGAVAPKVQTDRDEKA